MKLLFRVLLLACLGPAAVQAQLALGGGSGTAPIDSSTVAESPPAPDWLIWRAFHSSLAFYSGESREEVNAMLWQRAGLTEVDASLVLNAGDRYLQELSTVDGAARRNVEAMRKALGEPADIVRAHGQSPAVSADASGAVRIDVAQVLRDALVADGIIARVEADRQDAYRKHRRDLAAAIGHLKLAALDSLVKTDVSPNVRTFPLPRLDSLQHNLARSP